MIRFVRTIFAILVVLSSGGVTTAGILGDACRDEAAMRAVRGQVAAACHCDLAVSHKSYVKCAKGIIKTAARTRGMSGGCRKEVLQHEAHSICGRIGAVACCQAKRGGGVRATIAKSAERCRGVACLGAQSARDACSPAGTCAGASAAFRSIQGVFKQSCALPTCHSAVAREGGLVLDSEDVSYESLAGAPAELPEAKAMGLMRVEPMHPERSFLVRKLRNQGPGTAMPQGAPLLPESIIRVVEDWIRRGALTTLAECAGAAVGAVDCDGGPIDVGDFHWTPEPPLEVPATSTGLQLHVPGPERTVDPGTEWEMCFTIRPDWEKISAALGFPPGKRPTIRRQEYRLHQGSHHFVLGAYFGQHPEVWPDGFFPCVAGSCVNPEDCPPDAGQFLLPIGGTQVAGTRYIVEYPDGVGLPIIGDPVLIADLHATNTFLPAQEIYSEVWANLYFDKPGESSVLLDGFLAYNTKELFVEPFESKTISEIWQPHSLFGGQSVAAAVFQVFGHMHKRGTLFQIEFVKGGTCSAGGAVCGRDDDCACGPGHPECVGGQRCVLGADAEDTTIYRTTEWDHSPVRDFGKPYLLVNQNQGLRWTCTHVNGVRGDATRPPKTCHVGCGSCGWHADTQTCVFTRGVELGFDAAPRVFQKDEPMPLVWDKSADDDMCNMFGYFIHQSDLATLP